MSNKIENKRIYFVGIKGIAMSALAIYCKQRGYIVAGSDVDEEFPSQEELSAYAIPIYSGFHEDHINEFKPDLVIYTGAHNGFENIEAKYAYTLKISCLPHGKALGMFMKDYKQVSVAGCHGKTTTASILALLSHFMGINASYAIGVGSIQQIGPAGHAGTNDWFIAEADEYATDPGHDLTPRFLWQHPEILIITNIDYDHPDIYKDQNAIMTAYIDLAKNITDNGIMIINGDDKPSNIFKNNKKSITVGFSKHNDYQILILESDENYSHFTLVHKSNELGLFKLAIPGKHNILNASMACIAASHMGASWLSIQNNLLKYTGAKRRFEIFAYKNDILYIDDYAHHPTEISATLDAVKEKYSKETIYVVFQPHTFSRTKALLEEFSKCFSVADYVILTDIYGSARETNYDSTVISLLKDRLSHNHSHVHFIKQINDISTFLKKTVKPHSVVVFLGAGDIYNWSRQII